MGSFGGVFHLPGKASWVSGGVATLAVCALTVLLSALNGPVFFTTLPAGVLCFVALPGGVAELLAFVALEWLSLGSVLLAVVFDSIQGEAILEKVILFSLVVGGDLDLVDVPVVLC